MFRVYPRPAIPRTFPILPFSRPPCRFSVLLILVPFPFYPSSLGLALPSPDPPWLDYPISCSLDRKSVV